jgi:hypothetical protein
VASDRGERVYVALSPTLLRRAREEGRLEAPVSAHAVTAELLAELGEVDVEDAEYVALTSAALDSVSLLAGEDPPRRVVAAVDVQGWEPAAGDHPSAVTVQHPVPWRRVASLHVDGTDAEETVAAARDALQHDPHAAEPDTEHALERCLAHEPGWYGVQEADAVLADLFLGSSGGRATIA